MRYTLRCQFCGAKFDDDGFILECPNKHKPALLVTDYSTKRFDPNKRALGIHRYQSWLPTLRDVPSSVTTVTYQSQWLSRITNLPNLWIAFNGYWPEKGAKLESATFKELEVYSILSRIPKNDNRILVISSAGNTAAAFARICSQKKFPCLIVIPENGIHKMKFVNPLDPYVKFVSLVGSADYHDAIAIADRISRLDGFFSANSVKNVARRDGAGTSLLNAVETIGRLPDYYFQAISSGSGAIAVHEAAKRIIGDGRFGQKLPRLMLSQNYPFIPIFLSWKSKQPQLIKINCDEAKKNSRQIVAHVLSNQQPPYSIKGGIFDILSESQGNMLVANNLETLHAIELFKSSEGIDIDPASGVAFATLINATKHGQIDRHKLVLLHITGGGWYRYGLDNKLVLAKPDLQMDLHNTSMEETLDKVLKLSCKN
jgi:cysteate synthase